MSKGARPLLLDLFCCQGGAASGYHRAGFEVIGVDINPQPLYPFQFVRADVLELFADNRWDFYDRVIAIHASPPCQFATVYLTSSRTYCSYTGSNSCGIPQANPCPRAPRVCFVFRKQEQLTLEVAA